MSIAATLKTVPRSDPVPADFEGFVLRHGAELVAFARRLTLDHHRAEDIVQDALARCARSWHRIMGLDNPRAYVYRAVINEANSWHRRRSSREYPAVDVVNDLTDHRPGFESRVDDDHQLRRALAGLSAKQRAVLVLRYYCDASDEDIAVTVGCAVPTVRSHALRGLQRLRAAIAADDVPTDLNNELEGRNR